MRIEIFIGEKEFIWGESLQSWVVDLYVGINGRLASNGAVGQESTGGRETPVRVLTYRGDAEESQFRGAQIDSHPGKKPQVPERQGPPR